MLINLGVRVESANILSFTRDANRKLVLLALCGIPVNQTNFPVINEGTIYITFIIVNCSIVIKEITATTEEKPTITLPKGKDDTAFGELIEILAENTVFYAHKLLLQIRGFVHPNIK